MKRYGLWLTLCLVLAINGWVLFGVFQNRSASSPDAIRLTERELTIKKRGSENTGLYLKLEWSMPAYRDSLQGADEEDNWLDKGKMEALGFDVSHSPGSSNAWKFYSFQPPIQAYAVLEYDGPAWKGWMQDAQARKVTLAEQLQGETDPAKRKQLESTMLRLERLLVAKSRLMAVDAGRNRAQLEQKYPNPARYLVTPAVFGVSIGYRLKTPGEKVRVPFVHGRITEILVDEIHIPKEFRKFFDPLKLSRGFDQHYLPVDKPVEEMRPRYSVALNTGRRGEPWIGDPEMLAEE